MDGLTPPDQNSSVTQPQPKAVAIPVSVIDPTSQPNPEPQATTAVNNQTSPAPPPPPELPSELPARKPWRRPVAVALILLAVAGGTFAFRTAGQKSAVGATDATQKFAQQSAPLANLSQKLGQVLGDNVLTVNGQLHVSGTMVLEPTVKPANPTPGQLYYDQATSSLGYYNGKGFVYLQGGGNTFVTNNITNAAPVTNNNVTNVTNVTNITNPTSGGGFTGTGTPGAIAMFTAGSTLGDSVIIQSGTNLTAGSNTGTSATTLQGGTGGLTLLTGGTTGTSGNVVLSSGASSTTAAGNVTVDTGAGVVSGTQIDDKSFDDGNSDFCGTGNDDMGAWFGGTTTVTSAQAHTGTNSLAFTTNNSGNWAILQDDNCAGEPMVPGHHYFFSAWIRAAAGSTPATISGALFMNGFGGSPAAFSSATDTTTGWTQISGSGIAPAGATQGYFTLGGNFNTPGNTHYFDDITLVDLSSSSAVAQLNLGATNAQQVTLGNANEIGATAIQGGSGITLNSGVAGIGLTGGTISATSTGALTVTSGAASTWSINTGGVGGDLTIKAGSSSTASNAGNLILQPGANTGSGTAGSVIVKPQTDSTAAFQVQNAAGTNLVNVDTFNNTVTLGQAGSVGGSTYGRTDVGGSHASGYFGSGSILDAQQFTATNGGTVTSLSTFIGTVKAAPNNLGQMAIYADDGTNHPGAYVASTASHALAANAWNTFSITNGNAALTTGNKYWLVYWTNDDVNDSNNAQYFDSGVGGVVNYNGTFGTGVSFGTGPSNGMPSTFPAGGINQAGDYVSIYASYGGTAAPLTIGSDGSLTELGQARFQDTINSTAAFQIQNAAGSSLLTVDTTGNKISLGTNTNLLLQGATAYVSNSQAQNGSEAFGLNAANIGQLATALGNSAVADFEGTAIGNSANASIAGGKSVAIGYNASAYGWGVAVGTGANTTSFFSVAVGGIATAAEYATALGYGANAQNTSIALGEGTGTTAGHQLVIGGNVSQTSWIQDAYLGSGVTDVNPQDIAIHATGAAGTDLAGANLALAGGIGTGAGNGGSIYLRVAKPGISGASSNTLANVATLSGANGSALFQNSANSTSAFQIQDSTGNVLFNADSQNRQIGIGTTTGEATLTIKGSTIDSSAYAATFTNSGGDNLISARNDGQVVLGRATGCCSTFGHTSIGASPDNGFVNSVMAQQITTGPAPSTLNSISVYVQNATGTPNNKYILGIYADSGGTPGALIASSAQGTLTPNAWNTLGVSASLAASTTYWLAFSTNTSSNSAHYVPFDAGGNHQYMGGWANAGVSFPGTFTSTFSSGALDSIYANVVESGGLGTTLTVDPNSGVNVTTPTNTATAFQVQNAIGTALLTADTSTMTVTVQKLVVTGDLTVNGHIVTGGSAPGIAAGAAACTGPTVTISGTDTSGTITITTGTGCPAGGTLATITFAGAYAAAPHVNITPGGANAQTLGAYVDDSTITTTGFNLGTTGTPAGTTTYKWNYWVAQ